MENEDKYKDKIRLMKNSFDSIRFLLKSLEIALENEDEFIQAKAELTADFLLDAFDDLSEDLMKMREVWELKLEGKFTHS